MMPIDVFLQRQIFKWVCVTEVSFLRLGWSLLIEEAVYVQSINWWKWSFWTVSTSALEDWLLHEWQFSNTKKDNCSLGHHSPPLSTRCRGLPSQLEHVFVLVARGLQLGLFVYKREDSGLCPPAAVKTVLENQSKVSTSELTLGKIKKPHPNKQTLNKRPSGLKWRPLG